MTELLIIADPGLDIAEHLLVPGRALLFNPNRAHPIFVVFDIGSAGKM